MRTKCSICTNDKRIEIDRAVVNGGSLARIGEKFHVPYSTLWHHSREHITRQLATALGQKNALESANLLSGIEDLLDRTKNILTIAEDSKKYNLALDAIREGRGIYELLSKIAFSLHQAKVAELELERERSGEAQQEREMARGDQLSILTDAELDLLELLSRKIETQDASMIIVTGDQVQWSDPQTREESLPGSRVQSTSTSNPLPERKSHRTKWPQDRYRVKTIDPVTIPDGSDLS